MADHITLPELQASLMSLVDEMMADVPQPLTDEILTFDRLAERLQAAGKSSYETTVRRLMNSYEQQGRIVYAGKFVNEKGRPVKGWKVVK